MATRRKQIVLLFSGVLAIFVSAAFVIGSLKPARDITIIVDGNPNQRLAVRFVADGRATDETLTLPFKKSFKANKFSYWLLPDNEINDSEVTLQILVNDVPLWPANNNTLGLSTGVKGTLYTGRLFEFGGEISGSGLSAEEVAAFGYGE